MQNSMSDWLKKTAFLIQAILIGLGLAFLWILISGKGLKDTPGSTQNFSTMSFSNAVERAGPAVVSIRTATIEERQSRYTNSIRRRLLPNGLGSGVIIDSSGLVLTNYHVIKNVDRILVTLPDGRNAIARIVGSDEDTDISLLSIDNGGVKLDLPTLEFASSTKQKIGDVVLAIGNPHGIGQTVTQGIISATGRANINLATFEDFIQTDANISDGNSGGALVNTRGELIGINTAVYTEQGEKSGIGFAIPADLAKGVVDELLLNGRVIRGWLGLGTGSFVDARGKPVPTNIKGAIIGEVYANSPAAQVGIQKSDILTAINETVINTEIEAKYTIAGLKPGETVKLRIQRGNNLYDVEATVAERPQNIGVG